MPAEQLLSYADAQYGCNIDVGAQGRFFLAELVDEGHAYVQIVCGEGVANVFQLIQFVEGHSAGFIEKFAADVCQFAAAQCVVQFWANGKLVFVAKFPLREDGEYASVAEFLGGIYVFV